MGRQSVTAMYIVKNEETFLPYSIRSIYDAVDEIIVVDNGSTDHTAEIARSFRKAKVIPCDAYGDFAMLRNVALDHAQGEWVMKLDADEVFYPDLASRMEVLTQAPGVDAYTCWFYHLIPDYWHMQNTSDHDALYHRVFLIRKHNGLRWKNPVHESLEGIGGSIHDSGLHYVHYGYTKGVHQVAEKFSFYARLEGIPDPMEHISPEDIFNGRIIHPFRKPHPPVIQAFVDRAKH
ncbi:glycosyltransferase family 2 protein [Paenibacillus cymbidii]|uniref:glycosyltransferase family 2 protein n=1 Tax=Paenibacillus cymbidii TaxID=1639034 RepID=UPI001081CB40|nr:glycosyltransferase family 2 protein [Paenibacillus cymbidii]